MSRPPRKAPVPPPAAEAGESARERIVQAATREFAEHGFGGARIEAIGRAAGVNKALFYYYFAGKEELYRALVLDHVQALGRGLAAAEDPAAPPGETLERMTVAFIELAEARPFAPQFLVREVLDGWSHLRDEDFPVLLAQSRPVVETVRRGIERGAFRPVPPLFVHLLLMGAMNIFLVSAKGRARGSRVVGQPDIDPDPRAFARFVAELLAQGLAAPTPGDPPSFHLPGAPA